MKRRVGESGGMKRIGNLYEKICSKENLLKAHEKASQGKRWYEEVKEVNAHLDERIDEIQKSLTEKTFHTSPYEIFYKNEGRKERKIYKLPYCPDRIVQWAILLVIEEYIVRNLITDTFSAIPGRGIHYGLKRVQQALYSDREGCEYCLKLDVRHYYQCIDHEILKAKYRRLFKDEDLLWLLDEIIDSVDTCEPEDMIKIWGSADTGRHTGIPIGNYLSQYSGNYYLSSFDHWMKEEMGAKHYFRNMDDITIFSSSKEQLHEWLTKIDECFREELKIFIKPNYQIFPTYVRGVDFLGYRMFGDYTLLRKDTAKTMKKKMVNIRKRCESDYMTPTQFSVIGSYEGWLKWGDCYRLHSKYIAPLNIDRGIYYDTFIVPTKKKKGAKQNDTVQRDEEHGEAAAA